MKKLACFVNNNSFLEKLTDFCESEKFTLVNLMVEKCELDVSFIVLITDDEKLLKEHSSDDLSLCFIGRLNDSSLKLLFLDENFDDIQLRYLVDAVCHNGSMENSVMSVRPVKIEKSFSVANDIFNVERIVYILTKEFIYFLDFNSLEKVRIGLAEMITNAIEHGNLCISGDQKLHSTENGTYYHLIEERLKDERYKDRRVTFEYRVSGEGVSIAIEDQGSGFKVEEIPDPTMLEGLFKLHGRGILITRMYFDEVNYNSIGNRVELIKRF
jgi:anti-sigma regulatory factor (Ser/Thr protein kinase)